MDIQCAKCGRHFNDIAILRSHKCVPQEQKEKIDPFKNVVWLKENDVVRNNLDTD
jgi:hypothetical protein